MIDSDDKIIEGQLESGNQGAEKEKEKAPAPAAAPAAAAAKKAGKDGQSARSLAILSAIVAAGTLTLVVLIILIISLAKPLSAMRVFNDLGMYETALNSGCYYIDGRLRSKNADVVDERGNFNIVAATPELSDDDMVEALDVTIKLSYDLMRKYGDADLKTTKRFAQKLDRNIRIYLSLSDYMQISKAKNAQNIDAMSPELRPFVYDYVHSLLVMDYHARMYMDELDKMAFNVSEKGNIMTTLNERAQAFAAYNITAQTERSLRIYYIDQYVDYIDQLNRYLSVEQNRLGVTKLLSEADAKDKYKNILDGYEFSLFITPERGFTNVYRYLSLTKYAQLAVEISPETEEEQLHQLYWLNVFASFSDRMCNLGRLLFNNRDAYGIYSEEIREQYTTWTFDYYRYVRYEGNNRILSAVYENLMANYLRNFA